MIILDFDFSPQDQEEFVRYFEGSHVAPEAFSWEVPHGTLKFVIDNVDFSNYFADDGRTSLIEFAVSLKSCLALASPELRCGVLHLDYGQCLEVYRFEAQSYTVRDRHENQVDVGAKSLQDAVQEFSLRLYESVIEPNLSTLDCLNYDGGRPILDEWMKVLLCPVSEIDSEMAWHCSAFPNEK